MTLTLEPAVQAAPHNTPRKLLDYAPGLFDKLAAYVAKDRQVTRPYAEQVMEQTLIWLQACADNPSQRIGMTEAVDHGWHAFLLHSQDYAEFCDRAFGGYLHHVPPAPGQSMTREEIEETLPALQATGYPVDPVFWNGPGYGCCPPQPCVRAMPASTCTGTGAPPPAASGPAQA
ncbi:glycine-rich domain-containing protein [Actinomadura algeriensis]|uniref:Uncharacterized protein n=1 Tax=Actinomadura algeriensis TaxID=1679523 RepID=A0ABR9K2J4_9ACTN|nr:hypothetical protein [Actinomadura algeriensis]MBE1537069.1 hypothetical protein [Actinomadura algeriensis]